MIIFVLSNQFSRVLCNAVTHKYGWLWLLFIENEFGGTKKAMPDHVINELGLVGPVSLLLYFLFENDLQKNGEVALNAKCKYCIPFLA